MSEEGEEVKPITDLGTPHRGVTVGRLVGVGLYRELLQSTHSGRLGVGLLAAPQAPCRGYPRRGVNLGQGM